MKNNYSINEKNQLEWCFKHYGNLMVNLQIIQIDNDKKSMYILANADVSVLNQITIYNMSKNMFDFIIEAASLKLDNAQIHYENYVCHQHTNSLPFELVISAINTYTRRLWIDEALSNL